MTNLLFVLLLAALLAILLAWSFRALPGERWQILATVPLRKGPDNTWQGVNLTMYGLLLSGGTAFAVALFVLMLASLGIDATAICGLLLAVLGGSVPAAKLIARLVEGKKHTLTIGGASFVGLLLTPPVVLLFNRLWLSGPADETLPMVPVLAALTVAYLFGEGIGRLACISFGCCYGKPLSAIGPTGRRLFRHLHFTFHGATKKIAYASGLEGVRVVPIQAITATVSVAGGLVGLLLFLEGHTTAAFLLSLTLSQGWRAYSETLRADYRGEGSLSAYQVMALVAICLAALPLIWFQPGPPASLPRLADGLVALWRLPVVLLLQSIWIGLFLYTGCSMVTGSQLTFHVREDRI